MKSAAFALLFPALIVSGCTKTRTCECTRTDLSSGTTTQDTYTIRSKKKPVKEACKNYEQSDAFEKVTCKLK
jgi:hypothetical protein